MYKDALACSKKALTDQTLLFCSERDEVLSHSRGEPNLCGELNELHHKVNLKMSNVDIALHFANVSGVTPSRFPCEGSAEGGVA